MIIAVSGSVGEGKDTFTDLFIKHNPSFVNKKFASKLKEICAILAGCKVSDFEDNDFKNSLMAPSWKHPKTGERITYRFFLQYVGTDLFRDHFNKNFWVDALMADYDESQNWIISDFRFLTEAKAIKERGGVTINISRLTWVSDWLSSKYFKGCVIEKKLANLKDKIVSKNQLVDLITNNDWFIDNNLWNQITHISERELYLYYRDKFDHTVLNNGTLEDFENTVIGIGSLINSK